MSFDGWREVKWKEIKNFNDIEMWCWNWFTDSYWMEVVVVILLIILIYFGFFK